jgi:oxygen-dependent protoporphyrinogen oxidase
VVCVGYRKDRIKQSDGFGFLVPGREGRKILGTLWDSNIFPNRAPDGYVLFRSMLGGARASELAMKDDELLTDIVAGELRDIMDITVQPDFVRVYRHEKGIPQYLRDHGKRLENIYGILRKYPGLHLSGNSYQGIGVNDCIENSHKLAEKIASGI